MIIRRGFLKGIIAILVLSILHKIVLAKPKPPKLVKPIKEDFYLEVSARRSGKTLRLVKHLIKYIEDTEETVYLISPTNYMRQLVLDCIPKRLHHKVLYPEKINMSLKIYFDEPGLITNESYKLFTARGYYAGTPQGKTYFNPVTRKFEDNFLWQVVQWNNGEYERYTPYHWMSEDNPYKKTSSMWKDNLDYIQYAQEFKGEFI